MDRKEIIDRYKKTEDKLLVAKFLDKIELSKKRNKIEITDFLNEMEQNILNKVIRLMEIQNCILYGGIYDADRKIVVIYPEKMKDLFEENSFKYDTIFSVFRITVPEEDTKNFNHSVYLGGIIKLGIKRSQIGDIIVHGSSADIIVKKESEKFLYANLKTLTRFKDSEISIIKLEDIAKCDKKFSESKLITSSLRLDNIVSELAKTSRNKASEIIEQERVFVNYECECKNTKLIKEHDIITIRGNGKYIIDEIVGNTKKGNYVIIIKKYV